MKDIEQAVNRWLQKKEPVALATVVQSWGSSPRQVGAKLAIGPDAEMVGSVSGGCVEGAVVSEARESLVDGKPRLLHYGVSDEKAWSVGLSCGGKIWIYVEPLDRRWWKALTKRADQEWPVASLTVIDGAAAGTKLIVDETGEPIWRGNLLGPQSEELLVKAARQRLGEERSGREEVGGLDVLIECLLPRPRLIIVGGAHAAMALQRFAATMGYRVILVDPRQAFATRERFPEVEEIYHQYPQEIFPQLELDRRTCVAVLTHDPKIDDPALHLALESTAPYVGVLSSRKTHEKRVARLLADGLDPQLIGQIRTPIGLDIGARTPEEIALAIMAEIVAVRNAAK